jgi:hypothetical protein
MIATDRADGGRIKSARSLADPAALQRTFG